MLIKRYKKRLPGHYFGNPKGLIPRKMFFSFITQLDLIIHQFKGTVKPVLDDTQKRSSWAGGRLKKTP